MPIIITVGTAGGGRGISLSIRSQAPGHSSARGGWLAMDRLWRAAITGASPLPSGGIIFMKSLPREAVLGQVRRRSFLPARNLLSSMHGSCACSRGGKKGRDVFDARVKASCGAFFGEKKRRNTVSATKRTVVSGKPTTTSQGERPSR